MWILDLETDNLLPELTKIHCAVLYDTISEAYIKFAPGHNDLQSLPAYLSKNCPELSCHNGHSFDLKVLKKLYNYEYNGKYRDTLLMSRILWPDIEGGHSVEAWGDRFGVEKPKHEDWATFSLEMLYRCEEDVKIQTMLYKHIEEYVNEMSISNSHVDLDAVFRFEHKVSEIWEIQMNNGWTFDERKAFDYIDTLENMLVGIDKELIPSLPLRVVRPTETVTKAFKADGKITSNAAKWISRSDQLVGDFSKVAFEQINLGSPTQLKDFLLDAGWKPWNYNVKKDKYNKPIKDKYNKPIISGPKLPKEEDEWEYVAKLTGNSSIRMIAQRNKIKHRLNVIKGWVAEVKPNGRVYGQIINCGTNTARARHAVIVNVPKVSEKKFFGREMRSLFVASPGKVMVGADAMALEARIAGHYLYNIDRDEGLKYVTGEIHNTNASVWQCDRDTAKTGLYLLIFGGGASKLAGALGRPICEAEKLYEAFWRANPVLRELREKAEEKYKKVGYLLGLDSRPLSIRYKHAIISSLFQSGGAIAMKAALCVLHKRLQEIGESGYLGNFHDEFQNECTPEMADKVGELMVYSVREAGKVLKLNIPLDAEYKIGYSWADTH